MEENNRPHRRIKTRPSYDLRKKVLLKNFLREQMSPTHLQTSIDHEVVRVTGTSEDEMLDIENLDSPSEAMIIDDQQNSIEMSSSDVEMDACTSNKRKIGSPFKNPTIFDFTKITQLKLSQFNTFKKKCPTLSAEAVKIIADKNSVHLEKNIKVDVDVKKKVKSSNSIFKRKFNNYLSWKRKPTIEDGKKRGILKTKDMLKSSKFLFKQQLDKSIHESKSSKLNKVRKIIASVHHAIKGDNPGSKDIQQDFMSQAPPQHSIFRLRQYSNGCSRHGSFNNGILIDFENEENNSDIPERVQIIKGIMKRQYFPKYKTYNKSLDNISKDPHNLVSRLLRRKSFSRIKDDRFLANNSDIIWSLNEIRKLEKANKRLREENKLLSESLSSIMADVSLRSPRKHVNNPCSSSTSGSPSTSKEGIFHSPRCKVLRSRSVQDRGDRRREIKSRLSSHSMCHHPYSRTLYRAKPCIVNPSEEVPLPYPLSDHSYIKSISRRSSMPERVAKKPLVNRRASFTFENKTITRQNLLTLPTEAFY